MTASELPREAVPLASLSTSLQEIQKSTSQQPQEHQPNLKPSKPSGVSYKAANRVAQSILRDCNGIESSKSSSDNFKPNVPSRPTPADVLSVLRLLPFGRNTQRLSVIPKGESFVYSVNAGLTTGRKQRPQISSLCNKCPAVVEILARFESVYELNGRKDPVDETVDSAASDSLYSRRFFYTSITINKNYAANAHRDANHESGLARLIALGDSAGGELWVEDPDAQEDPDGEGKIGKCDNDSEETDGKKIRISLRNKFTPEQLSGPNGEAGEVVDIKNKWFDFNARLLHKVMPFQGERYSLVYFTHEVRMECDEDQANYIANFSEANNLNSDTAEVQESSAIGDSSIAGENTTNSSKTTDGEDPLQLLPPRETKRQLTELGVAWPPALKKVLYEPGDFRNGGKGVSQKMEGTSSSEDEKRGLAAESELSDEGTSGNESLKMKDVGLRAVPTENPMRENTGALHAASGSSPQEREKQFLVVAKSHHFLERENNSQSLSFFKGDLRQYSDFAVLECQSLGAMFRVRADWSGMVKPTTLRAGLTQAPNVFQPVLVEKTTLRGRGTGQGGLKKMSDFEDADAETIPPHIRSFSDRCATCQVWEVISPGARSTEELVLFEDVVEELNVLEQKYREASGSDSCYVDHIDLTVIKPSSDCQEVSAKARKEIGRIARERLREAILEAESPRANAGSESQSRQPSTTSSPVPRPSQWAVIMKYVDGGCDKKQIVYYIARLIEKQGCDSLSLSTRNGSMISARPKSTSTALRSDLAYLLGNLAKLKPGSLVYDPFAGEGSILKVAAEAFGAICLGADVVNVWEAEKSHNNHGGSNEAPKLFDFVRGNVFNSPYRLNGKVDAIICDPPFGRREGLCGPRAQDPGKNLENGDAKDNDASTSTFLPLPLLVRSILTLAAKTLVQRGRLVFLFPDWPGNDSPDAAWLRPDNMLRLCNEGLASPGTSSAASNPIVGDSGALYATLKLVGRAEQVWHKTKTGHTMLRRAVVFEKLAGKR